MDWQRGDWRQGHPLLRVKRRPIKVGPVSEDEPLSPDALLGYETEEVHPVYVAGHCAVYEMSPGEFHVHKNGWTESRPFKTTDPVLAREVCDRWEEVYQAARGWARQDGAAGSGAR